MMTVKEALDVFGNFNAFRESPTSLPPHFPEPRQLNEACEVVRNFLQNAIVLTGQDIKTIRGIMTELDHNEAVMVSDYNEPITPLTPEYYNEILKRFNETRK